MKLHNIPTGFGTAHSHNYNWSFCLHANTDYFLIAVCYLGISGKMQIL